MLNACGCGCLLCVETWSGPYVVVVFPSSSCVEGFWNGPWVAESPIAETCGVASGWPRYHAPSSMCQRENDGGAP